MRLTLLLALLATIAGTEVHAQQIILPCVPSGPSCIPVSAANPLPTTGNTVTSVTIGTTTLTSGTDTRVLFQDGASPTGVLQENAAFTFTKASGLLSVTGLSASGTGSIGVASGVASTALTVQGSDATSGTNALVVRNGTPTTLLTVRDDGPVIIANNLSVAGAIVNAGIASDATHTDTTVCQDTTTHTFLSGSGTAGICLGNVSSIRFKEAWQPLSDSLSIIMALNPGTWRYKPGIADSGVKLQIGFLAEDYAQVLPEWTRYDNQGRPNGDDMLAVLPQLVRALQQVDDKLEAYKRSHP